MKTGTSQLTSIRGNKSKSIGLLHWSRKPSINLRNSLGKRSELSWEGSSTRVNWRQVRRLLLPKNSFNNRQLLVFSPRSSCHWLLSWWRRHINWKPYINSAFFQESLVFATLWLYIHHCRNWKKRTGKLFMRRPKLLTQKINDKWLQSISNCKHLWIKNICLENHLFKYLCNYLYCWIMFPLARSISIKSWVFLTYFFNFPCLVL